MQFTWKELQHELACEECPGSNLRYYSDELLGHLIEDHGWPVNEAEKLVGQILFEHEPANDYGKWEGLIDAN